MAASLTWVTPPGSVANFSIGNPSTTKLVVADTSNTGATLTYSKISGDLPPGLSLNSDGVVSGTPQYATSSNNYFISLDYEFIVRVISSDGRVLDGKFIIIITNTVNQDFLWTTPEGILGTVPNGNFYSLTLQAQSSANLGITYSLVSGELPPGMQLISHRVTKTITATQFSTSTTVKVSNTQTISVNDYVFGTKIAAGTRVADINAATNTVTLTVATTGAVATGDTIDMYSPGLLQGVPTILDPLAVNESRSYRFTVRATNSLNRITDRAFSLNVTNIYGPIIEPETTFLGSYFDGDFFNQQLEIIQLNPAVEIEWAVTSGQLPPGLTLNSAGAITGYLEPVQLIGRYGPSGYDGINTAQIGTTATMSNCTISGTTLIVGSFSGSIQSQMYLTGANVAVNTYIVESLGSNRYTITPPSNVAISDTTIIGTILNANQEQQYDTGPYQFNQLSQNVAYTFTVQAFDGANYDLQTYVLNVVSRPNYTADSSLGIDDAYLTVDSGNVYIPVIRNTSTILPVARQDAYYAAKIDGYDFGGYSLTYKIVNTAGTYDGSPFDPLNRDNFNNGLPGSFDFVSATVSNLPGVNLDSDSGWIFGKINPQTSAYEEFDFGIEVCKTIGYGVASNIRLSINANITVNTTQFITQRFANSVTAANLSVLANVTSSTIYVTPVSGNVTLLDNSLWVSNSSSLNATVTNTSFYQVEYCSRPTYFTLPVVGDPNSIITWTSPIDLGTINNGTVSELRVEAVSAIGVKILYNLVDERGVSCRLPQGLTLLPTGEIAGRATFESFSVDDHTTTFDNELLVVDRTAIFRVRAETVDGSASSTRTFTLKLNLIDTEPYENLYLKAMPPVSKRQMYNSLISDSDIFNETSIYRPDDPNFGVQKDLTMLFLPGLRPSEISEYQTAMIENHFTKTYTFGDVKVAYVLDDTYEIKYEVVYVEIVDPGENDRGAGPVQSKDLSSIIDNPYISQNGTAYNIIYPNSSDNMTRRMEEIVGYQDQSSLPPWMTSNQPDATTATGFTIPLGYTKAVVIAYAQKNNGEKIAYNLRKSNFDFNQIEFTVDRYQVDNYYSSNYNIATEAYIRDRETTFDSDQNINIGAIVSSVTYAVTVPYSQINGRPLEYILANGGIDGIDNFANGETLIFTKQEQFEDSGPYDGWVDYSGAYIGDNIETNEIEGFDKNEAGVYDAYTVVPGFIEKNQKSVASSTVSVTNVNYDQSISTRTINQRRVGNGTTTVGDLATSSTTENVAITVNSVPLIRYIDYTISGTDIIFSVAPAVGADIVATIQISTVVGKTYTLTVDNTVGLTPGSEIVFSGTSFGNLVPTIGYTILSIVDDTRVTINQPAGERRFVEQLITGNAVTTAFSLVSSADINDTLVYINGTLLETTKYTVSGSTITFATPPLSSDIVLVKIYSNLGGKEIFTASGSMTGSVYTNQRGGIWRINIVNGIVNLIFEKEVSVYDRVNVLFGKTLGSAILTYSIDLEPGQTVPFYEVFVINPTIRVRTTFNNDTTKFFTRRDQYYEPGSEDKYVKFPQYGVFT